MSAHGDSPRRHTPRLRHRHPLRVHLRGEVCRPLLTTEALSLNSRQIRDSSQLSEFRDLHNLTGQWDCLHLLSYTGIFQKIREFPGHC